MGYGDDAPADQRRAHEPMGTKPAAQCGGQGDEWQIGDVEEADSGVDCVVRKVEIFGEPSCFCVAQIGPVELVEHVCDCEEWKDLLCSVGFPDMQRRMHYHEIQFSI